MQQLPEVPTMASNGESRNILITVDESPASDKVFGWALQQFYRAGDTVHILHVIAPARRLVVSVQTACQAAQPLSSICHTCSADVGVGSALWCLWVGGQGGAWCQAGRSHVVLH